MSMSNSDKSAKGPPDSHGQSDNKGKTDGNDTTEHKSVRPKDAAPTLQDAADKAAMRDHPEDKSATARRTTPAGKGRSQ